MRSLRSAPLGLAVLLFVAGALALVEEGGRGREEGLPAGSVFDESEEGLSVAFAYLGARPGAQVTVLAKRVGHERLPPDAVLFRIKPLRHPVTPSPGEAQADPGGEEELKPNEKGKPTGGSRKKEAKREKAERKDQGEETTPPPLLSPAEEDWVRSGGRLVLATDKDYGPLEIARSRAPLEVVKVFPVWPGVHTLAGRVQDRALTRALTRAATRAVIGGVNTSVVTEAITLFARGDLPVLSRLVLGRGEVLLLALPEIFQNDSLGKDDHLRLLVALAGEGRPVLFDEWAHGLGREDGLVELLLEWGFGPFLVLCALGFLTWLWRGRRFVGAPDPDPAEGRSEAVDLVDSLAQLYDRALSRREAAQLYRDGFEKAVGARTGLRGRALARRVGEFLGGKGGTMARAPGARVKDLAPSEFLRELHTVGDAYRRLYEHAHSRRRL